MNWLIVEDALKDRRGHWIEYASTFVRDLQALGDEVVVLCDSRAQGFVMEQTGAMPVLPESIWHRMGDGAGAMKRYLRVPGHAIATFFAIRKFFKNFNHRGHGEHGVGVDKKHKLADSPVSLNPTSRCLQAASSPPDWIFVPTVLAHHLLGWWLLLKLKSVPHKSRVLLFFPNLPIRLDEERQAHWMGGPTTKLMAWLFVSLRKEVKSGRVVLGVETHAMRRALERLIGMPVVYLPHPVSAKPSQEESRGAGLVSSDKQQAVVADRPFLAASASTIVFGCYGAARWEKGSDIFLKAIRLLLERGNENVQGFRFAIQWVEDFQDNQGNTVSFDPWLQEHPQVEVIGRYFEGSEYERRLKQTDVMVLPYRKPYQLRVSRVVIEAMLNGLPVIATRGTTLYEQAEEHGIVFGCDDGNAESLAGAMLAISQSFQITRAEAEKKATPAAESFSVGYFKELLAKNGQKLPTLDAGCPSLLPKL